jgi:hypothetical protein
MLVSWYHVVSCGLGSESETERQRQNTEISIRCCRVGQSSVVLQYVPLRPVQRQQVHVHDDGAVRGEWHWWRHEKSVGAWE